MDLVLNEVQTLLQQTTREFVANHSSMRRLRTLRDSQDPLGYSPDLWAQMAGLGWLGIIIPEEHGGIGLGYAHLMVVLEELGRGLMPEPILSSVLLGATTVMLAGTSEQQAAVLPGIAAGELRLALAGREVRARYSRTHIETRAEPNGAGWKISGEKIQVIDGFGADRFIVPARTAGAIDDAAGITLFLIDATAPGVTVERQWRIDSRNSALVCFDQVAATADQVLGEVGAGSGVLSTVIDRATAGLCAEMLGSMNAAMDTTVDYLKTRKQFGVPIGSFQALKHRAAKMFIESELSRSAVLAANLAIDEGSPDVASYVSVAKARCSDAFVLIANETVQMHGGIGMTDECDAGFFVKRARVAEMTFGDAAYHRNRFATGRGY